MSYISGVILTPLKKIENSLGDVYHGMKISDIGYDGFQEAYFSTIHCGTIKPWKKHLQMTLNLIVPMGEIQFVLYDDRKGSFTRNTFMEVKLSLNNYQRLTVPPNVWMAFRGEAKGINLLLNIANFEHDPLEIVRADIDHFKFKW